MATHLPALEKAGAWRNQGGTGWEAARGAARAMVGEVRAPMPFPRGVIARWPTSVWRGMHWRRYLRPPLAGRLRRCKFATNLPSCAARLRSTAYQPSMGTNFFPLLPIDIWFILSRSVEIMVKSLPSKCQIGDVN
ncbi:uncharacterized protein LOC124703560 [Lolium rigidum]|uniref:uncharacterized protein LOC124703560 n=1 Tax=Lolium rigidum TaxID=89674 RepID=UPI001F5C5023|nr:uncharacterized protein LOC124703560 [Lolium rigidum]